MTVFCAHAQKFFGEVFLKLLKDAIKVAVLGDLLLYRLYQAEVVVSKSGELLDVLAGFVDFVEQQHSISELVFPQCLDERL